MKSTGEPFRIAAGGASASISAAGSLVYGLRRPDPHALVRVDRTGHTVGVIAESRAVVSEPEFSPDGRMVSAMLNFRSISVWETERGVETRVTGDDEPALHGSWLPGTSEIAHTRLGKAGGTWVRRQDGSGSARQLLDQGALAADFSANSKYSRLLRRGSRNGPRSLGQRDGQGGQWIRRFAHEGQRGAPADLAGREVRGVSVRRDWPLGDLRDAVPAWRRAGSRLNGWRRACHLESEGWRSSTSRATT